MNEQELSIEDIQHIMGLSYPTARKVAKSHGVLRDRKWFVRASVVQDMINQHILNAQRMQIRFEAKSQ